MGSKKAESTETLKVKKAKTKVKVAMAASLGICLPEALNKKLVADAKKRKIRKSALVRMILEEQYSRKTA